MTNQSDFQKTILGYTKGFFVSHIATFDLITCNPIAIATSVLTQNSDLDQIPVKDKNSIIGVLERTSHNENVLVKDCMVPLSEKILVTGNFPINEFLKILDSEPSYRLIIEGSNITGIVTKSDLLKLPVRIYCFALISNIEILLKLIIEDRFHDDSWLDMLSGDRQKNINNRYKKDTERLLNLSKIDATEFNEKLDIVLSLKIFKESFKEDITNIISFRNDINHSKKRYLPQNDLNAFISLLKTSEYWIEELSNYFHS